MVDIIPYSSHSYYINNPIKFDCLTLIFLLCKKIKTHTLTNSKYYGDFFKFNKFIELYYKVKFNLYLNKHLCI